MLKRLGVEFKAQSAGRRSRAILQEALDNGLGAMIGLRGVHCVVLVGLEGDAMTIINNTPPKLQQMPLSAWDGWAIVLYPGAPVTPRLPPDAVVQGFG